MLLSPVSSGCIQYLYNYSLYTIHLVLCILYSIYTFTHCISFILYSVFCTVFIHLFIVYHSSCTVYSVLYLYIYLQLYSIHLVQCILFTIYTFIHCIPFTFYSVFCIVFIHIVSLLSEFPKDLMKSISTEWYFSGQDCKASFSQRSP